MTLPYPTDGIYQIVIVYAVTIFALDDRVSITKKRSQEIRNTFGGVAGLPLSRS